MKTENEKLMAIEEKIDAQIEALRKLQEELEEIDVDKLEEESEEESDVDRYTSDTPEQYIMDIDSAIMALEERGSVL